SMLIFINIVGGIPNSFSELNKLFSNTSYFENAAKIVQGFGIYLAFLDYLRLTGIIRSIMVVITVLSAPQILAVLGVADVFVNFKKLMTKRKD
ncbi:MAG: hypothetical protein CME66_11555, partial [Halobacteriovoraceae bacterium]|nr:hypothetical protein [Halobacteriovoraceae bacterium]